MPDQLAAVVSPSPPPQPPLCNLPLHKSHSHRRLSLAPRPVSTFMDTATVPCSPTIGAATSHPLHASPPPARLSSIRPPLHHLPALPTRTRLPLIAQPLIPPPPPPQYRPYLLTAADNVQQPSPITAANNRYDHRQSYLELPTANSNPTSVLPPPPFPNKTPSRSPLSHLSPPQPLSTPCGCRPSLPDCCQCR